MSHVFTFEQRSKAQKGKHRCPEEFFGMHLKPKQHRRAIRARLIAERGHKCERCTNAEWLGQPITLELEHVDGDGLNHARTNLLLLCPNCHSQTPTWRRKKINALLVE